MASTAEDTSEEDAEEAGWRGEGSRGRFRFADAPGRKQYLYRPNFRAQQEQAEVRRFDRFAERLPDLRAAMSSRMDNAVLDRERVAAIATRLINQGWFRIGTERYAQESKTFGSTTLRKGHVHVRGQS